VAVSILVPYGGPGCSYRDRNLDYVLEHYRRNHGDWGVITGRCGEPWSKGSAIADARMQTTADVLILADADSFVDPEIVTAAVAAVQSGTAWVVPHRMVYRLNERATEAVHAGAAPQGGRLARFPYASVPGGGITVLSATAFDTVRGLDDRFRGWGGEDVSFAIALLTLIGEPTILNGDLWHLWHPHPAPDLRGSPESEELVARYKAARLIPRLMRALIDRTEPDPPAVLNQPVRFRSRWPDHVVWFSRRGRSVTFIDGLYETTDPDEVDALRISVDIEEVHRVVRQRG
jgi:hypothetical protein